MKSEKRDGSTTNNPYVAFRRRTEKMQTRKVSSVPNRSDECQCHLNVKQSLRCANVDVGLLGDVLKYGPCEVICHIWTSALYVGRSVKLCMFIGCELILKW